MRARVFFIIVFIRTAIFIGRRANEENNNFKMSLVTRVYLYGRDRLQDAIINLVQEHVSRVDILYISEFQGPQSSM